MSKRRVQLAPGSVVPLADVHRLRRDAKVLHDTFGRRLLTEEQRHALRRGLNRVTRGALQKLARSNPSPELHAAVESELRRGALKGLSQTAGRAAGTGAIIDGCLSLVEAGQGWRAGHLTARQAAVHVARETAIGAIASAAGVAVAATVVTLTGGLAAPVVAAVGLGASITTRAALKALAD